MTGTPGTTTCRHCAGPVLFVMLDTGKRMPVDPTPDDEGTVAAHRDHRGDWIGHVLKADQRTAGFEKRFITHFATCGPVIAQRQAHRDGVRAGNVVPLRRPRGRAANR